VFRTSSYLANGLEEIIVVRFNAFLWPKCVLFTQYNAEFHTIEYFLDSSDRND
jgi:hypothetical protein